MACPHCRSPYTPSSAILKEMRIDPEKERINFFDVRGCTHCSFTGYMGRTGIFEFFKITEDIQRLILEKKGSHILKEAARRNGMKTLREDGWTKVRQGITTIPEVLRVTQEEEVLD